MLGRTTLVLAALLVASAPALGQAPPPQPERRTIAVSVLDKDGKAVHGLTAENFRGEFRGQPVRVLSATEDSSPRRLAILIDASASMRGAAAAEFIWAAARDCIERLAPRHQIAILTFSDTVESHSDLTDDRAALQEAFQKARARYRRGSTAIFDAILRTLEIQKLAGPSDSILVLTDGMDNASWRRSFQLDQTLVRAGVRVYFLWPRPALVSQQSFRENRRTKADLSPRASVTGGLFVDLREYGEASAPEAARPFYESLQNVYQLEAEFLLPVDKVRELKLELVDSDGNKLKDVEVAYPRLLVPLSEKKE